MRTVSADASVSWATTTAGSTTRIEADRKIRPADRGAEKAGIFRIGTDPPEEMGSQVGLCVVC
jgi:hypothetical protein